MVASDEDQLATDRRTQDRWRLAFCGSVRTFKRLPQHGFCFDEAPAAHQGCRTAVQDLEVPKGIEGGLRAQSIFQPRMQRQHIAVAIAYRDRCPADSTAHTGAVGCRPGLHARNGRPTTTRARSPARNPLPPPRAWRRSDSSPRPGRGLGRESAPAICIACVTSGRARSTSRAYSRRSARAQVICARTAGSGSVGSSCSSVAVTAASPRSSSSVA